MTGVSLCFQGLPKINHLNAGIYKRKPNDKDAKLKFTECKKIVQQMAFQVNLDFLNQS